MSTPAPVDQLADDTVMARRLERAEAKVAQLEFMIEDRSRSLYLAQDELRRSEGFIRKILRSMDSALLVTDLDCRILVVGGSAERLLGRDEAELLTLSLADVVESVDTCPLFDRTGESEREVGFVRPDGSVIPALVSTTPLLGDGGDGGDVVALVHVATDLSERHRLESDRRRSQKLESIGQLAAGVAHEINTPVQFIGDSTRFIGEVIEDLFALITTYQGALAELDDSVSDESRQRVTAAEDVADLDFVRDEAPQAVERTLNGVRRVSEIVAALKQFAHPGSSTGTPCDLAEIVRTTLVVASNEYRYHADVHTELNPVPTVLGDPGDFGQAVLNLVVNAAHAIADRGDDSRGRIGIRTSTDGEVVVLEVSDTGTGIAPEVRDRIFDPFFTTKEVGRGTGQGLAIVSSLLERHGGRIEVDTEVGRGTTFRLLLPVAASS